MKVVVFGATGLTGKELLRIALADGHEVTAVARNPAAVTEKHDRLRVVQAAGEDAAQVAAAIEGQDAVLSALGSRTRDKNTVRSDSARNIVAGMKQHGVRRLVWLSASGVGESKGQAERTSFVFGKIIMPLFLKDVYADAAIAEELIQKSGLESTLVRPVGLTNKPEKGNIWASGDLTQKPPSSQISRADVARWMVQQLTSSAWVGKAATLSNA